MGFLIGTVSNSKDTRNFQTTNKPIGLTSLLCILLGVGVLFGLAALLIHHGHTVGNYLRTPVYPHLALGGPPWPVTRLGVILSQLPIAIGVLVLMYLIVSAIVEDRMKH